MSRRKVKTNPAQTEKYSVIGVDQNKKLAKLISNLHGGVLIKAAICQLWRRACNLSLL